MLIRETGDAIHGKVRNYAGLWIWILRTNFQLSFPLFAAAVTCGMLSRVLNLAAFIAAIKCAYWLISPENMHSSLLATAGRFGLRELVPFIIAAVPPLLFVASGILQRQQIRFRTSTKASISLQIAEKILRTRLNGYEAEHRSQPVDLYRNALLKEYRQSIATVEKIEDIMISVIIHSVALIVALVVGAVFYPKIMLMLAGLGIVLSAVFLLQRHYASRRIAHLKQKLQAEQSDARAEIERQISEMLLREDEQRLPKEIDFRRYADTIRNTMLANDKFRADSQMFSSIGMSLVMLIFLISALELNGSGEEYLVGLAMLILLIRFILGNFQAILNLVALISTDYVPLQKLRMILD